MPHPTALDFFSYIQLRRIAIFKRLAEPKVRWADCQLVAGVDL